MTGRRGERFLDLVEVMDRLRSPGGCPWDAEQTHATLVKYLLEEAYETAEAIEDGDDAALREELGDVLLQVVFHARIAQDEQGWDIDGIAAGIADKLIRRHPHVFAGAPAKTAGDVEANWEALKVAEKGRTSAADGVPLAQPALALAAALVGRAAKAGLDVPVPGVIEAPDVVDADSIGDLLMAVVALARAAKVDPEAALRAAARRYRGLVQAAEGVGR
ncbi:MAG TPA: MazG family protein [Acidothermaceae bacterium]|nr:MazG family protein [Acidothermaceae bacterium]